jgi:hypothetical protein
LAGCGWVVKRRAKKPGLLRLRAASFSNIVAIALGS